MQCSVERLNRLPRKSLGIMGTGDTARLLLRLSHPDILSTTRRVIPSAISFVLYPFAQNKADFLPELLRNINRNGFPVSSIYRGCIFMVDSSAFVLYFDSLRVVIDQWKH